MLTVIIAVAVPANQSVNLHASQNANTSALLSANQSVSISAHLNANQNAMIITITTIIT